MHLAPVIVALLALLSSAEARAQGSSAAPDAAVFVGAGAGAPRLVAAELGVTFDQLSLIAGASWRLGPRSGVHTYAMLDAGLRVGFARGWGAWTARLGRGISKADDSVSDVDADVPYVALQPTTIGTQLDIRLGFPPTRWWLGIGVEAVTWREGFGNNPARYEGEFDVVPMMLLRWEWTSVTDSPE